MIRVSNQGFTLVELCVVLAVMAILATFAAPSFFVWQTRDQVDARARALFSTLSLGRAEAVRRGARAVGPCSSIAMAFRRSCACSRR
ncbi:putative uncharacterized protein [Caballeronia cordobensis]|nr:putative uncharacterized protein [Burkholderia sp. RPE67]